MLVDQSTNEIYIPLNDILPEQTGKLEMANSILSEEAVLGMSTNMLYKEVVSRAGNPIVFLSPISYCG
jgi:2-oxoglutarate dehydrogenase complex dehydrogenase (E1) component-like enzyme